MSTTVTYKDNTLTTVNNATKTLKTAGKYMEDDVTLIDISNEIYQDQNGYLVLDDLGDSGGGGDTSWTLLNSIDVQYSNASTTASFVINLVISESYDPTKILWISVRDTQGKRTGYYYGSDSIFLANAPSSSSTGQYCLIRSVGTSNGFWQATSSDAYGGIYPMTPRLSSDDGMIIRMMGKYSSTYSTGTIDSTYRISAYYVDYPSGLAPIGEALWATT